MENQLFISLYGSMTEIEERLNSFAGPGRKVTVIFIERKGEKVGTFQGLAVMEY